MKSPLSKHEEQRLAALHRYKLLDTAPERSFNDLARIVAAICDAPIGFISLIDRDRQWFKAFEGAHFVHETPRDTSFCTHTVAKAATLIVRDTLHDPRFRDNPFVTDAPFIRFYAGAPLITQDGYAIGSLCAIAHEPHELNTSQIEALEALARQVMALIELKHVSEELANALYEVKVLRGLLPICSYCHKIRDEAQSWHRLEEYIGDRSDVSFTHSICPHCLEQHFPEEL